MHTACTLTHCMHTACALHAHCMRTACALQVAIMPWYIDRVGLEGPGFLSLLRIIRAHRPPRV